MTFYPLDPNVDTEIPAEHEFYVPIVIFLPPRSKRGY